MCAARWVPVEELKQLASGRWAEILTQHGFPSDRISTVHGPCPKCGGEDRYRTFDDFSETGGLYCNQCFCRQNSDGFAALQWWLDCSFAEAVRKVADIVGGQVKARTRLTKPDPVQHLTLRAWHELPVKLWCRHKPGVTPESVQAAGGLPARYRDQYSVIAFPVLGSRGLASAPVGWALFDQSGGDLPVFQKNRSLPEWKKVKLTAGSESGLLGDAGRLIASPETIHTVWKVEGVSDCLALMGAIPPSETGHAVITTANGSREKPQAWILDALATTAAGTAGRVIVLHDCDQPGEDGATRWAAQLAGVCHEVRHVRLPYEIQATHGKDLRDWFHEGHTFDELLAMVEATKPTERRPVEADDTAPKCVINYNRTDSHGSCEPLSMERILANCFELTDGWPRRVGRMLFTFQAGEIQTIDNQPGYFGYLGQQTGRPSEFWRGPAYHTKAEVFEQVRRAAPAYDSIEYSPHEPEVPNRFYACPRSPEIEPGDGRALDTLLSLLSPATEQDRDLLRLMFVTPLWGGPSGTRPIFVLTSDAGRGVGKSATARIVGRLYGGHIDLTANEAFERIKERLLTPESLRYRVVLLDNVKSNRLSWSDFEGLITSPVVSGRALYIGESQRPNTLTFLMTMNGPSFSKDLSQRSVIIKLDRPEYSADWIHRLETFVDQHRQQIFADGIAFLRRERTAISGHSRWGAWESNVLQRLPDPSSIRKVIDERQRATDTDSDQSDLLQDYYRRRLGDLQYQADQEQIFIPTEYAARWYREALNDKFASTIGVMRSINQSIDESEFTNLFRIGRSYGRGVLWRGDLAGDKQILTDLEHRHELQTRGGSF